jgi:isopenicillin N synthase-like dioxygenase
VQIALPFGTTPSAEASNAAVTPLARRPEDMSQSLPIVDMSALATGGRYALAHLADAVGRAARGVGFFYLVGHGVDPSLVSAVFREAARFFDLPEADKNRQSITRSPHNRGYVAMKGERLDARAAPDLKEAFNIGLDLTPKDPRVTAGEPFRGLNQWPDLAGWREIMLSYFNAAWSVGRDLHKAIAIDLGLTPEFFGTKLDQPMATLRLLHYPPQPAKAASGQIGAGEHTDYGDITLLSTDSAGGLEVKRRDGDWMPAPTIPGAFICNIGDCLMRWTNDVYVSTPHRVVNNGVRHRYSVAFFLDPNPDAVIACLPTCVSATRPPRYPPITAADYLTQRLDATYGFRAARAGT